MKKTVLIYLAAVVLATLLSGASYALWNSADPSYTCAQCHEVKDSHARWSQSAHKDVACVECHAAALENGVEGLAEKLGMVFAHFSKDVKNSDIKMTEKQVLEISERCASCHKSESEKWALAGILRAIKISLRILHTTPKKSHMQTVSDATECFTTAI